MMSAIHGPTALNRIAKSIAMPTREQLASPIQLCDLPAAIHATAAHVAYEPGAGSPVGLTGVSVGYGDQDTGLGTETLSHGKYGEYLAGANNRLATDNVIDKDGPHLWPPDRFR
jgi:hypothetical protein